MCVNREASKVSPYYFLMFKIEVMGHMKNIYQMMQDGSFDGEFMPAYNEAVEQGKQSFAFSGNSVDIEYADAIVALVSDLRK